MKGATSPVPAEASLEQSPARGSSSLARLVIAVLLVVAVAIALRVPFLSSPGFKGDQFHNVFWSERTHSGDLASVYTLRPDGSGKYWCNYPPGYLYVLKGLGTVYDTLAPAESPLGPTVVMDIAEDRDTPARRLAVTLYKIPAVLADVLLGVLLLVSLRHRLGERLATGLALLYVAMPAIVHNSAIWGQMDAVPTLLVIASLEAARRRSVLWMAVWATFAVLVKAQACIVLPVWVIVSIRWTGTDLRRWLALLGVIAAILAVMVFPLRNVLDGVWASYAGAARYYPFTHLNGFNAWFLGVPLDTPHLEALSRFYVRDDVATSLGLTPRTLGLLGVLAAWAVVSVALWRRRCDDRSLFYAARVLPLAFFTMATQMHERYLYPAIALWVWSFVQSARWWVCWLVMSACVAVNVLWTWPGPIESQWAGWFTEVLHQTWFGIVPGIWCAVATLFVFVLAFSGWLEGKPSLWQSDSSAFEPATKPAPLASKVFHSLFQKE